MLKRSSIVMHAVIRNGVGLLLLFVNNESRARSVGIVLSRTQATEFSFSFLLIMNVNVFLCKN
jgi:hypothetical protein